MINEDTIRELFSSLRRTFSAQNVDDNIIWDAIGYSLEQYHEKAPKEVKNNEYKTYSWQRKTAVNRILDKKRKNKKNERLLRKNPKTGKSDHEWIERFHYYTIDRNIEAREVINIAKKLLPHDLWKIVELRYWDNYNFNEIASFLSASYFKVYRKHQRAMEILRNYFAPPPR